MWFTCLWFDLSITFPEGNFLLFLPFFVRRWLLHDLSKINFHVFVFLILFCIPLCVLSLWLLTFFTFCFFDMVVYYLRLGNKVVVKLLHSCFGMRYCAFPMSSISCCKIINLSLTVCAYILSLPLSLTVTLTEYHSVRNSLIFAFFMVRSFSWNLLECKIRFWYVGRCYFCF
jgi:hypothetical protein